MMLARSWRWSLSDELVEPSLRAGDLGGVVRLRTRPLQHEAVEGREFVRVEAQRRPPPGSGCASSVRVQSSTGMKL